MASNTTVWLTVEDVLDIHADQIARYGGLAGIKSMPLLESAVAAPLHHQLYGGENRWLRLAAQLACAIAKNHAFVTATSAPPPSRYWSSCTSTACGSRWTTAPTGSRLPSWSSN